MRSAGFTLAVIVAVLVPANGTELSKKEFQAARKLYNSKCAKCHRFYNPANYTEAAWQDWMSKMNHKAKVKPKQAELLTRYFATFREPSGAAATNSITRR